MSTLKAAWTALAHLTTCTNWSDANTLSEAVKLEKRQGFSLADARSQVMNQWLDGVTAPHTPCRDIYYKRPGCMAAFMLGVSHAVERLNHSYNGPMVHECIALMRAAGLEDAT